MLPGYGWQGPLVKSKSDENRSHKKIPSRGLFGVQRIPKEFRKSTKGGENEPSISDHEMARRIRARQQAMVDRIAMMDQRRHLQAEGRRYREEMGYRHKLERDYDAKSHHHDSYHAYQDQSRQCSGDKLEHFEDVETGVDGYYVDKLGGYSPPPPSNLPIRGQICGPSISESPRGTSHRHYQALSPSRHG